MADTDALFGSAFSRMEVKHEAVNCTISGINSSLSNSHNCSLIKQFQELPYEYDEKVKYITLVSYMLTFIFGLVGNSLVIYIIWHYDKVRVKSVANYYIWNLAFADELFILALPLFCWATFTRQWPIPGVMGTITCKLSYVIRDINKFSSIFLLVALSVDRCLASFHTLGSFRTNTIGKWVCLMIWITCAIIATPYLLYAQAITAADGTSCRLAWPQTPVKDSFPYLRFWTYFQFIVGLIIPSVIILASYIFLYVRLKSIQNRHENSSVKRPSKKMTQTVLVVVITFIFCQTPYHVLQFIAQGKVEKVQEYSARGERYLPPQTEVTTFVYLNLVSQFLIFVSSCCNPIIYGLLNENYRRLYTAVLCQNNRDLLTNGRYSRRETTFDLDTELPKPPVQLRFQIKFHLPCDSYYWRRFLKWRKNEKRNSSEKCIELDKVTDIPCVNGKDNYNDWQTMKDDIVEWQQSIMPGTSLMTS